LIEKLKTPLYATKRSAACRVGVAEAAVGKPMTEAVATCSN
jgi:hypothetical protein